MNHKQQDAFFQNLKSLEEMPEVEFPHALHGRIMQSLYLRQFRLPLYIINGILAVNFSISAYHLWNMVSARANQMAQGIEAISLGDRALYFSQALQAVPLDSTLIFLANFALIGAGAYLFYRLSSLLAIVRTPLENK